MFGRKKKPQPTKGIRLRNPKYNSPTKKYVKKYTTKQFKKFSPEIQQELTNRYTVILTDYKTRNEKFKEFGSKVSKGLASMEMNSKGTNKGVSYLDKPISIKAPDTLGSFGSIGSRKKKKSGYFDNLANF